MAIEIGTDWLTLYRQMLRCDRAIIAVATEQLWIQVWINHGNGRGAHT